MSEGTRNVILLSAGFVFGLWMYYLYTEGGTGLMLAEGWKGLIPALVVIAIAEVWYRRKKKN